MLYQPCDERTVRRERREHVDRLGLCVEIRSELGLSAEFGSNAFVEKILREVKWRGGG